MYIYQTGRQPSLSAVEIEALGGTIIKSIGQEFLLVKEYLPLELMGGTIKIVELLKTVQTTDIQQIKKLLTELPPQQLFAGSDGGKYNLGVSAFNVEIEPKQLTGVGLELKKKYKKRIEPIKLRIVPNNSQRLSNAQVLHNKLHRREHGAEIVLVQEGSQTHIALTVNTQDIDAYSARDHARPVRNMQVGMLPPKLAQIIINIATGGLPPQRYVLDPFCGSGVLLQELLRNGHSAYGSDISPEMIRASQANIKWYIDENDSSDDFVIEHGDATSHTWTLPITAVATEIDLGEPLNSQASPQKLEQLVQQSQQLTHKFLANISPQLAQATPLCIAVPTWRNGKQFSASLSVDELKQLGYTVRSFKHLNEELIYIRDNQFTGRRLLVLNKD